MKVTLAVEGCDGQVSYVEAESATYETAKAQAEARIPETFTLCLRQGMAVGGLTWDL